MAANVILILGGSDDDHAAYMLDYLSERGCDAELLDSRWFPAAMQIEFHPHRQRGAIRLPSGRRIDLAEIRSVYWRNYFGIGGPELPDPEQAWIAANDSRSLFESLLMQLPARWVNGWEAFELHQAKPVQLARVAQLGVLVPATLLANDGPAVREFVAAHTRCIVKPVQGGDHTAPLTADELTPKRLENLRLAPITVQEEIEGTNVRVFVAGDTVLACEVRTAALDYRADAQAELFVHALPQEIAVMSRNIAQELRLLWTGIDYRLTSGGRYFFLEANPSPMFLGFEAQTGLPLTASLAALLAA